MTKNKELFEQLVSEATQQGFSGWDFSFLSRRWCMNETSWDYRRNVLEKIKLANSLLDMGTGGGEFLSSLGPLPKITCATEGYLPNVPVAKARLEPLGVRVFEIRSDNTLPFDDNSFDLVINRHESFSAREVYRILKANGTFVTQQVGEKDNIRLNDFLHAPVDVEFASWTLDHAVKQLEEAGFHIVDRKEEFPETVVYDIGAVVYYLKAIPWQVPDFTVEKYYDRLIDIHSMIQRSGSLKLTSHRFYIEAVKH